MTGETAAELRARLNADYEIDQRIWTNNRGSRSAFENHVRRDWPAIDGMLARLAAAEADAESRVPDQCGSCESQDIFYDPADGWCCRSCGRTDADE